MKILRFDIAARVMHWSHAVVFIWLLLTGIHLFLTPKSLLGDSLIKMVHIYASAFVLSPMVIFFFRSTSLNSDLEELTSWASNDLRWFTGILKRDKTPAAGKFNPGQKANFMVTTLLIIGLSFSGSVIWMKSMFSVDFVELNFLLHDFLAVAFILLLTGHVLFVLYYSGSLRGIVYGTVDEKWVKHHYPEWFKQNTRHR